MNQDIITGISFSTRMLGLVICSHYQLLKFEIKLFKDKWTLAKQSHFITALTSCTRDYDIDAIVLSIPAKHHQTNEYKSIYELIKQYAYEKNIRFKEVERQKLGLLCQEGKKKNKKNQMETMVRYFNELLPIYNKEITNKNKYYEKVFEAVGSVIIYTIGVN